MRRLVKIRYLLQNRKLAIISPNRVVFLIQRENRLVAKPEKKNQLNSTKKTDVIHTFHELKCNFVAVCRMAIGLDQSRNAETMRKSKLVSHFNEILQHFIAIQFPIPNSSCIHIHTHTLSPSCLHLFNKSHI